MRSQWTRWIGLIWFLAIPALLILGAWRERIAARSNKRITDTLYRVDRVLCIWAETWGEPTEFVREKLLEAIKHDSQ